MRLIVDVIKRHRVAGYVREGEPWSGHDIDPRLVLGAGATLWFGIAEQGSRRRAFRVMATRLAVVLDVGDVGLAIDIADASIFDEICAWVTKAKKYTVPAREVREDEYIDWATEHQVWP